MSALPPHVAFTRRDGRQEVILHRSVAVIGRDRIELKSARGTVLLPLVGISLAIAVIAYLMTGGADLPFWALVGGLFFCLIVVPFSAMGLVSALVGADIVIDAKKGSATWQQGYLGMGIGTRELVPFPKIAPPGGHRRGRRARPVARGERRPPAVRAGAGEEEREAAHLRAGARARLRAG
jgi:hypothetical protein